MREVNVAIVGCGFVANWHLKAWKKVREARVVAVCDTDKKASKSAGEAWNISHYYTDISELLKLEKVSIVDICTPPQTHASLAVQAMESGCHVLLEKPMSMTTKEADEILHSQKVSGMKLGVIHSWLFQPTLLKARSMVDAGHVGDVIGAQIEVLGTKDDPLASNKEHWCHKLLGGRFGEMLAHPIYVLQHFLGHLQLETVSTAKMGDYTWMPSDELHMIFRSGKRFGTTYASFNSPRQTVLVSIYGKEAILRIELIAATITKLSHLEINNFTIGSDILRQAYQLMASTVKNAGRMIFRRWISGHDAYIRFFVDSVINNKEPPVTMEDAYEVVRVLEEVCKKISNIKRERQE